MFGKFNNKKPSNSGSTQIPITWVQVSSTQWVTPERRFSIASTTDDRFYILFDFLTDETIHIVTLEEAMKSVEETLHREWNEL